MSERSDEERTDPGAADLPDTLAAAYDDVFRLIDMTQSEGVASGDSDDEESPPPRAEDDDWPEPARPPPGVMRPREASESRPSPATLRRRVRTALKTMDLAIEAALDDPWGSPLPVAQRRKPSPYEGREY